MISGVTLPEYEIDASGVITILPGITTIPAGIRLEISRVLIVPSVTGILISYCETSPIFTSEVERRLSWIDPALRIVTESVSRAEYVLSPSVGVPG